MSSESAVEKYFTQLLDKLCSIDEVGVMTLEIGISRRYECSSGFTNLVIIQGSLSQFNSGLDTSAV